MRTISLALLTILLLLPATGIAMSSFNGDHIPANTKNLSNDNNQANNQLTVDGTYNQFIPHLNLEFLDNTTAVISVDVNENGIYENNEIVYHLSIGEGISEAVTSSSMKITANNTYFVEYLVSLETTNSFLTTTVRVYHYQPYIYFEELATAVDNTVQIRGIRFDNNNNLNQVGDYAGGTGQTEVSITQGPNFSVSQFPRWVGWRNSTNELVTALMLRNNMDHYTPYVQTGPGDDQVLGLNELTLDPQDDKSSYHAESLFMVDYASNFNKVEEIAYEFTSYNSVVDRSLPLLSADNPTTYFLGINDTSIWNEMTTIIGGSSVPRIITNNRNPYYNADQVELGFERIMVYANNFDIACEMFDSSCSTYNFQTIKKDKSVTMMYKVEFYDHLGWGFSNLISQATINLTLYPHTPQVIIKTDVIKSRDDGFRFEISYDIESYDYFVADQDDIFEKIFSEYDYTPNIGYHRKISLVSSKTNHQLVAENSALSTNAAGEFYIDFYHDNPLLFTLLSSLDRVNTGDHLKGISYITIAPDVNIDLNYPLFKRVELLDAPAKNFNVAQTTIQTKSVRTTQMVKGDFDGDLADELVLGYHDDGNYDTNTHKLQYTDYNNDYWYLHSLNPYPSPSLQRIGTAKPYDDVVVNPHTSQEELLHRNKEGSWFTDSDFSFSSTDLIAEEGVFADFDDDSGLEVFANNSIYNVVSPGKYELITTVPNFVAAEVYDVDQDGKDELVGLLFSPDRLEVIDLNTGYNIAHTRNLSDFVMENYSNHFIHIATGDIDRDSVFELIFAYNEPEPVNQFHLGIFEFDLSIDVFGLISIAKVPNGISDMAVFDIDNDGHTEVFYSGYHTSKGGIIDFVNGQFERNDYDFGSERSTIEAGDFNHDYIPDAIVSTWPEGDLLFFQLIPPSGSIIDEIDPTLQINSPTPNQSVSGTVRIDISVDDNIGIEKVDYFIGYDLVHTVYLSPYDWDFDTTLYEDGSYELWVRVTDLGGNEVSQSVTILIYNENESTIQIEYLYPKEGAILNEMVEVRIKITSTYAVLRVEYLLDNDLQITLSKDPYSWNWNTSAYDEKTYTLAAKVIDVEGNYRSNLISVTVDHDYVPPEIKNPQLNIEYSLWWVISATLILGILPKLKYRKSREIKV